VTGIDTRKKFIDKELDGESTTYNTGVRQYDPEGPGFASVDPLWEEFRAWTPYHYAHDNPVGLKDPSGLQVGEKNDNGGGGAISPAGGSVAPEGYWSVRPVFRGLSRFWRNLTGSGSGGSSATTASGAGAGGNAGASAGSRGAVRMEPGQGTVKRLTQGSNRPATAGAGKATAREAPGFIVTPNGKAFPVPQGAKGPIPTRAPGMQFTEGSGGNGLDPRVSGVRFMDANANQGARAVYMNNSNQRVNPLTGQTVSPNDPAAHYYFFP